MAYDEYEEEWEERLQGVVYEEDESRYFYEEDDDDFPIRQESPTLEFSIDPSDFGRVGFGGRGLGGVIAGPGREKSLRDPRSVSLEQMRGILNDTVYRKLGDHIKDAAYMLVEELPEKQMVLYSIDILTAAALYTVKYRDKGGVTKKNISDFLAATQDLSRINHLDFIRYIRLLEKWYIEEK